MCIRDSNRTMQNRIEETNDFEMKIQNDPFVPLDAIKLKMHGQVRVKHEHVQPTDTIPQFSSLKQDHGESLMDHTKRFKQSVDDLKATFRKEFLSECTEKTDSFENCSAPDEKQTLKKEAFSSWMSHMFLKNCDDNEHGTLKKSL